VLVTLVETKEDVLKRFKTVYRYSPAAGDTGLWDD